MTVFSHDVLFQAFDWDSSKYHGSAGNWYVFGLCREGGFGLV